MIDVIEERDRAGHEAVNERVVLALIALSGDDGGDDVIGLDLGIGLEQIVHGEQRAVGSVGLHVAFPHVEHVGHVVGGEQRLQLFEIVHAGWRSFGDDLDAGVGGFEVGVELIAQRLFGRGGAADEHANRAGRCGGCGGGSGFGVAAGFCGGSGRRSGGCATGGQRCAGAADADELEQSASADAV